MIKTRGDMYSGRYFFITLSLYASQVARGLARSNIVRGETRMTQMIKSSRYKKMLLRIEDKSLVPILLQIMSLTGGAC